MLGDEGVSALEQGLGVAWELLGHLLPVEAVLTRQRHEHRIRFRRPFLDVRGGERVDWRIEVNGVATVAIALEPSLEAGRRLSHARDRANECGPVSERSGLVV